MKVKEKNRISNFIHQRSAPLFTKVGTLSRVHRILICILTFAVVMGGFYYFFYMPRHEEMTRLGDEHLRLKGQLDTYKRKAALLNKFKKKMAEAQIRFDSAMTALPDKKEIPNLLTDISNSGKDAGLEFILFQPRAEVKTAYYAEIPVDIKVQGGYHQVGEFFDKVSRLHRIVNMKNITMMPAKQEGNLLTSCTAVTYMFVEKKSNKGKKKKK
ncbi:type IV pilus assembly protein PilO [Desulfocicer vacuolatum DSM 3385]|uniref:Type IV pilus assembly protein PilO n=1 Tax=Desulfocicer vacuolatum DSM 3385 TaxID=1121400 RepID=A0A1W1ZU81_9BACT|nr:type 4a pilus biogenesis protein PilO [Desulfocicer vacuolatum]SMC52000.1 type IV pilus assembly protein PilO [Desulfocicer vacuolatum DSM 3385]